MASTHHRYPANVSLQMAEGSVFWDVFIDGILPRHVGNLLGRICCSGDEYSALPILSCCLFLAFLAMCSTFSRPWIRKENQNCTRAALQALLAIMVPTCSLWSGHHIKLVNVLRSRVDIPLQVIIKDTVDGIIEFRSPIDNLADLMSSGATVNGHTICINIDWKWWIDFLEWWILAKPKSGLPSYLSRLSDWSHSDVHTTNSNPLGLSLRPFALTPSSSTSCPLLCLDRLPHGTIPSLDASPEVILEFTAFSPSLRTLGTAHVLSAIPFIMPDGSRGRPRSLVSVLKQLGTSHGPNLLIRSVSNVSADYEHALRRVYTSLSEEHQIREMWVETLGIKAWRQDMFIVALEAALVRLGWIERWAVQVTII